MQENIFDSPHIKRTYFRLAMPLVFSMAVTMVYNLADTYFVAATGDTAIVAGVSLCSPVFSLLMAIGNIYGQGGSSLLSRLLGENRPDDIRRVSAFCFYMSLLSGAVIGILMMLLKTPVLGLLGADLETLPHASAYYMWMAIGSPLVVASFIHTNLLRAEGLAAQSMIATIGGALVNIVLDPIFISVLGLGAAGAAIATVLGYVFTVVCCIVVVHTRSAYLSLDIRSVGIPGRYVQQIYAIGTAAALANIMASICTIMVNQALLPYGNDKIAAMGIALKVSMIVMLVLTGFSFGGLPQFGYYYGANDKARLLQLLRFCSVFLAGLAVVLSAVVFMAAPWFMQRFMDDAQIIADGAMMLRLQVVSMVCVGLILLYTLVFQAAGMALISLILSISRQGVVFIVVLLVLQTLLGYTGVLAAQAVSDVITLGLAVYLFYTRFYQPLLR